MSTTRQRTAFRICEAALERPVEARAAFLAEACGGDDALRREVEALLAQESAANSFIETPALDLALDEGETAPGLAIGQSLGTYQVLAWLGAGGMGEVYRARDTELGREVALKVLPPMLLADPERLARFEREARVLAALNHPNIGAIYGLAHQDGVRALVLELVDGLTLAERIAQGPLPLSESLTIAVQVAEALEAAHETGIVHRDLKPANIKITPSGAAKVLDFGLAKLTRAAESTHGDRAAAITVDGTQPGLIVGTAAYMSPEQARGLAVDKRTDIWALGCVLYEMLTGRRAFDGEDSSAVLARVLERDPDLALLPAATPPAIRRLLRRCLSKDRKRRLPDIAAARLEIEDAQSQPTVDAIVAPTPRRPWFAWAIPILTLLVGASAVWAIMRLHDAAATDAPQTRFQIAMPDQLEHPGLYNFSVSPDGRQLAFNAVNNLELPMVARPSRGGLDHAIHVWVRSLDSLDARLLAGTEGARGRVFWSPDSGFIAFRAGRKLKKIDVSGGLAQVVCDMPGEFWGGGSWSRQGVILFGDGNGVIWRVPEAGGVATPVMPSNPSQPELRQGFPVFLPDGRHFLFKRWPAPGEREGIYIGSLDAKPDRQGAGPLIETRFDATHVPPSGARSGYVLFRREKTLLAQPFDDHTLRLSGSPVSVAEGLGSSDDTLADLAPNVRAYGFFSASTTGVLVYRTGSPSNVQLTWLDRQGHTVSRVGDSARYSSVALSPDGSTAVVRRSETETAAQQLWLMNLGSGISTRFTFGPQQHCCPVWSPDGRRIAFGTNLAERTSGAGWRVFEKPTNSAAEEQPRVKPGGNQIPTDWSRDGRFMLYTEESSTTKDDIWVQPTDDGNAFPFLATAFNEGDARFSPDARWVAYSSDESGQEEVYVRVFAPNGAGGRWLVSKGGGLVARWRGDGKELFYNAPDGSVMAVDVTTFKGEFHAGIPRPLFKGVNADPSPARASDWDVTADGTRFLIAVPAEQNLRPPFTVVLNWQAGLQTK